MFNHLYNFKVSKVQKIDIFIIMNLKKHKEHAIAFYRTSYLGQPELATEKYVDKEYIQHNPEVANGKLGFIDYFNRMQEEYPYKSIEFVRCIAEENLVALHTHQT